MGRWASAWGTEQTLSGRYASADSDWAGEKSARKNREMADAIASAKLGNGHCAILDRGCSSNWSCNTTQPAIVKFIHDSYPLAEKSAEHSSRFILEGLFWEAYLKAFPDCQLGKWASVGEKFPRALCDKMKDEFETREAMSRKRYEAGKPLLISKEEVRAELPDNRFSALAGLSGLRKA